MEMAKTSRAEDKRNEKHKAHIHHHNQQRTGRLRLLALKEKTGVYKKSNR